MNVQPPTRRAIDLLVPVIFLTVAHHASGQGWVAVRQGAPVIGADSTPYLKKHEWQIGSAYRWQRSFRHFAGTEEQPRRRLERSEVINNTHTLDVSATYALTDRRSLTLSIPWFIGKRSGRDNLDLQNFGGAANRNRPFFGVTSRAERGDVSQLSDMTLVLRQWILDMAPESKGNVSLGFGVKIPSGDPGVETVERFIPSGMARTAANIRTRIRTVDQSIQPGDGGWGVIFDIQAFRQVSPFNNVYLTGTYLANPREVNGVPTGRGRPGEAIMSVADQYVLRVGGVFGALFKNRRYSFGLGMRWEGVPVHDLLGQSGGFRRPGYAISVEPTLIRSVGKETFTISIPFAVQRNRQASVSDIEENEGEAGDAAFADYLILASYTRRI